MAYPKELRNRLGISLDAFATLVDCGRSHLAMAEAGERILPAGATSITLLLLEQATANEPITTADIPPKAFLKRRLANLHVALETLQQALEQLNEKQEKTALLLSAGKKLDNDPFTSEIANLQWQVLLRKAAARQIKQQLECAKIKLSLAAKAAEITEIGNMLAAG